MVNSKPEKLSKYFKFVTRLGTYLPTYLPTYACSADWSPEAKMAKLTPGHITPGEPFPPPSPPLFFVLFLFI